MPGDDRIIARLLIVVIIIGVICGLVGRKVDAERKNMIEASFNTGSTDNATTR